MDVDLSEQFMRNDMTSNRNGIKAFVFLTLYLGNIDAIAGSSITSIFELLQKKQANNEEVTVTGYLSNNQGGEVFFLYPYEIDASFFDATRAIAVFFTNNINKQNQKRCTEKYVSIKGSYSFKPGKIQRQLHSIKYVEVLGELDEIGNLKTCWQAK